MSLEIRDLLPAMGAVSPEKGNGRRNSTGLMRPSTDVPKYLRASTGSCHDLCKFGRRHETETKPWISSGPRRRIDRKPPEKIVTTTDEVSPDRKKYLKPKLVLSSVSKGKLPDSSSSSQQKIPSSEKRMSGGGKSKGASKPLVTTSGLSDPGRAVKERASSDLKVSRQASEKVKERRLSENSATHSRTKTATAALTSSSRSPAASLGLTSKDRKAAVVNTGIPNRMRVKKAVIASTSWVPTKSSPGSAQTSVRRRLWKPKAVITQRDQKVARDHGIQRIEREVPEKTLYVIDVESNNALKLFDQCAISVKNELPESKVNEFISERPPSPSPSPSVAESSSQQNSPTVSSHEEGKKEMENSCEEYSYHEEGDNDDDDSDDDGEEEEVGLEYSGSESETFCGLESSETQIKGEEIISAVDGVSRRSRETPKRVHPEGADAKPMKLKFRRGGVVDIQSDDNTPRRLKFRRRKPIGQEEARTPSQRRVPKKREVSADLNEASDLSSEKYALRSCGVQEKKAGQGGLFNNVIEETASKLVETRKSKVKALVGAFETVISLQDRKPSATNPG